MTLHIDHQIDVRSRGLRGGTCTMRCCAGREADRAAFARAHDRSPFARVANAVRPGASADPITTPVQIAGSLLVDLFDQGVEPGREFRKRKAFEVCLARYRTELDGTHLCLDIELAECFVEKEIANLAEHVVLIARVARKMERDTDLVQVGFDAGKNLVSGDSNAGHFDSHEGPSPWTERHDDPPFEGWRLRVESLNNGEGDFQPTGADDELSLAVVKDRAELEGQVGMDGRQRAGETVEHTFAITFEVVQLILVSNEPFPEACFAREIAERESLHPAHEYLSLHHFDDKLPELAQSLFNITRFLRVLM